MHTLTWNTTFSRKNASSTSNSCPFESMVVLDKRLSRLPTLRADDNDGSRLCSWRVRGVTFALVLCWCLVAIGRLEACLFGYGLWSGVVALTDGA
jgi:hypothetical protein